MLTLIWLDMDFVLCHKTRATIAVWPTHNRSTIRYNCTNQLSFLKPKEKKKHPDRHTVEYEVDNIVFITNFTKSYGTQHLYELEVIIPILSVNSAKQWKLLYMSAFVIGRLKSHSMTSQSPVRTCSRTKVPSCQRGQHNPFLFKKRQDKPVDREWQVGPTISICI